jgi:hypothetical protein
VLIVNGIFREEDWEAALPRAEPEPEPDAADFARLRLGIDLERRQEELLRARGHRVILNCSRQWGKSTLAAAKAVHKAYTAPGSLILVASPGKRQSSEFVRKAAEMVAKLGITPVGDGSNAKSLLFPNGSRLVGLPGKEATTRGYSQASMLLFDEASRVEDSLYKALTPSIAVGNGDLWMMSTPFGKQGFFYNTWAHGGDHWLRVSVPVTENPRISSEFLEEQRRDMGMSFEQDYMCEFMDFGSGAFDRSVVERALDELEEAWEFEPIWRG